MSYLRADGRVGTLRWFVCLLLVAAYALLLDSPGTSDVTVFWSTWQHLVRHHGLVEGYRLAQSDYLPGAFIVLHAVDRLGMRMGNEGFLVLKFALLSCVALGVLVYGAWGRSFWAGMALLTALMVSSVGGAYLDVLYLPFLVLTVRAMVDRQPWRAGMFLGLCLSFKWQPLLIAPFVAAHVMDASYADWRERAPWLRLLRFLGGVLPFGLGWCFTFGATAIGDSFRHAVSHSALSYQALNLGWAIQGWLERGGGWTEAPFELAAPPAVTWLLKGLFFTAYALLGLVFLRRRRRADEAVYFCFCAALAYFVLQVGVHENHAFVPMILAFCLLPVARPDAREHATFVAILANVNLVVFYGLQGRTPLLIANPAGIEAAVGILATTYFAVCFWLAVRERGPAPPVAAA